MPARGSSKKTVCWQDQDCPVSLPPIKRKPKPRKPRKKKRFHQAFRVLIALGLIPTKSRQCDPLGLRLKRMHVMDGEVEKAGEGAPDLAKMLEEIPAKTEVAATNGTSHLNGTQVPEPDETVKQEDKVPEVKEELKSENNEPEKEAPAPVEEAVQPRPQTPKEEEEPVASELSRKRSVEKEAEGEGSSGSDSDSSRKRPKVEQEPNTIPTSTSRGNRSPVEDERERMISEFVSEVSTNSDSLGEATERLAKEVESLGELAATKEMEWNAILRVKKLKEEMLERLLRRKRINCLDEQPVHDRFPDQMHNKMPNNNPMALMMRNPRMPDMSKQQRPILPKPLTSPYAMPPMGREGRNGPIVDVKSIIDDYRSRHPDNVPRRGRRMRGMPPEPRFTSNPSLISMANMALGTGASVRTVTDHINMNYMGVEQAARNEMQNKEVMKPNGAKPYPEVTLHPVSPPSLLHQVLTKSAPPRPASFSPTLARLLTAPERPPAPPPHFRPPSKVSIADILSSTKKSRNEITITPVAGIPGGKNKDEIVHLDDDDGDGGDRLVIDEGNEDVPQCQGCRQKSAQFVCAGCGNQWYCSRDCQVSAWEEHSEVCTG